MSGAKKAVSAILIAALASCGWSAVYAEDSLTTENDKYSVYVTPEVASECGPNNYMAYRVAHMDGNVEYGCWTLNASRTEVEVWWPDRTRDNFTYHQLRPNLEN